MEDEGGRPRCGSLDSLSLGIRMGTKRDDVWLDEDGRVPPDDGGMSVCPEDPARLSPGLRPSQLPGGEGHWPVWRIHAEQLPEELVFVPSKPKKKLVMHGLIRPRAPMSPEALQALLCSTRDLWERVT
jgi:hypothetical protein